MFFQPVKNLPPSSNGSERINSLKQLLSHSFVVGELHSDIASKKFLITNMSSLKKEGFVTLFLEGLPTSVQSKIDEFMNRPELELDPEIKAILREMDKCLPLKQITENVLKSMDEYSDFLPLKNFRRQLPSNKDDIEPQMQTILRNVERTLIRESKCFLLRIAEKHDEIPESLQQCKNNNYTQLVLTAKKHGIRIICLDSKEMLDEGRLALKSIELSSSFMKKRIREGNDFFASVIEYNQPATGEKWLALMGEEHAKNSEYCGLAQRLDVGSLFFKQVASNEAIECSVESVEETYCSTSTKHSHICIRTTSSELRLPLLDISMEEEIAYPISEGSVSAPRL